VCDVVVVVVVKWADEKWSIHGKGNTKRGWQEGDDTADGWWCLLKYHGSGGGSQKLLFG
jgi:hypothetical protein